MRTRWLDRVLVGAAVLLVVGIGGQAIASRLGGGAKPRPTAQRVESTAPPTPRYTVHYAVDNGFHDLGTYRSVPLRGSPETQFLRTCPLGRLRVLVQPGPRLSLRYSGPPCIPPAVELTALVRDPSGERTRPVPALGPAGRALLSRHLAGAERVVAPLANGLLRCRSGRPDDLRTAQNGHVLRGTIPCRAQR